MRRIPAVLALVAACALLAGLLAGRGPNATEKKIAAELTVRANELCWEAGGLPKGEARDGWAETVVSVNCNEVGPPRPECGLDLCFYCGERHNCNDHSEDGEAGDGE
jgi:hypothetical protein